MEKTNRHGPMTIGGLARAAGVGVETVRYYQRLGLLPMPERPAGGNRTYTDAMLGRMMFIRQAQSLGFTLAQVKTLIALSQEDGGSGKEMLRGKLQELDMRIDELERMRKEVRRSLAQCERAKAGDPCPFLRALSERESRTAS